MVWKEPLKPKLVKYPNISKEGLTKIAKDSLKMKQKCQLLNHKYPENDSEVWTGGPQGIVYGQVISGRTIKEQSTIIVNFST